MSRLTALASIWTIVAMTTAAPSMAGTAATTLWFDPRDVTFGTVGGGGTQTLRITGDTSQDITVVFPTGRPPNFQGGTRAGGGCGSGNQFVCTGTGDVTLSYGPNRYDDLGYFIEASTPDGGYALGSVSLISYTDLEVWRQWTRYIGFELGTTANFDVGIRQLGVSPAQRPQLFLDGLDTRLGVPGNCAVSGSMTICDLPDDFTGTTVLTFTVPACSAVQPVEVNVRPWNVDTNEDNNSYVAPGLAEPPWNCLHPPAGGGPSGGGSSGGGTSGAGSGGLPVASGAASAPAGASANPRTSPSSSAVPPGSPPPNAAPGADDPALSPVAVVGILGAGAVVVLGALVTWWWYGRSWLGNRRSRAGYEPAEPPPSS